MPVKAADPRPAGGPVIEVPWGHMPRATVVHLEVGGAQPGRLYCRYFVDMDSGVEIERASQDGVLVWRAHVQPSRLVPGTAYIQEDVSYFRIAGGQPGGRYPPQQFRLVPGSAYFQKVGARIEEDRVVVDVLGGGHLVEVRDLGTGRQISRQYK